MQRYCKEVIIFRQLNHPNVLRIEGAARSVFNTSDYCMVSQWMNNEDILKYVTQHPRTNRLELVRLMRQRPDFVLTRTHVVGRGHPRSQLSPQQRSRPRRSQECTWRLCTFFSSIEFPLPS